MKTKRQQFSTLSALMCLSGVFAFVSSCDQIVEPSATRREPYTTHDFEMIASTGHTRPIVVEPFTYHTEWDTYPQGKRITVNDREFIPALRALVPVLRTTNYHGDFDLVLMYESKDVTMIWVKYHGKELIYRLNDHSYVGGDAEKLSSAMQRIGGPVASR